MKQGLNDYKECASFLEEVGGCLARRNSRWALPTVCSPRSCLQLFITLLKRERGYFFKSIQRCHTTRSVVRGVVYWAQFVAVVPWGFHCRLLHELIRRWHTEVLVKTACTRRRSSPRRRSGLVRSTRSALDLDLKKHCSTIRASDVTEDQGRAQFASEVASRVIS